LKEVAVVGVGGVAVVANIVVGVAFEVIVGILVSVVYSSGPYAEDLIVAETIEVEKAGEIGSERLNVEVKFGVVLAVAPSADVEFEAEELAVAAFVVAFVAASVVASVAASVVVVPFVVFAACFVVEVC
jgi:hypothetical protein